MSKTYTFYDDSYYERPPCDCCSGGWVERYNSSDTNSNLGSAHSEEDCYVQAILTETDIYDEDDDLWCQPLKYLKRIAEELGIEIKIIS